MATVANKPFETNYRIPTQTGYVVLNGAQITKIEALRVTNVFGLQQEDWKIVFHLSDGSKQEIGHSNWTRNFVHEVFESDS